MYFNNISIIFPIIFKNMKITHFLFFLVVVVSAISCKQRTEAEKIVDAAIEAHGPLASHRCDFHRPPRRGRGPVFLRLSIRRLRRRAHFVPDRLTGDRSGPERLFALAHIEIQNAESPFPCPIPTFSKSGLTWPT